MRSFSSRRFALVVAIFTLLSCFAYSVSAASSSAAPSPSAEGELICHTDNQAECYPKVFSATDEFQVVHDDQDLPPGLHVRMDIYSGVKEAKLYTPGADDAALEGLPVDQSVLVVDPEPAEDVPRIPQGAPVYEPVGAVKEPQVQDPDFTAALEFLKEHAETAPGAEKHPLDDALVDLEDISHDMYYGSKIIEDEDAVKSLFCLLTARNAEQATWATIQQRDFLASSILSSSLQNNPPALRHLEDHWENLMESQCAAHQKPLKDVFFSSLEPSVQSSADQRLEAAWTQRLLPVVARLLKSDTIRPEFMDADGMKHFLQILLKKEDAWAVPRARVSRIVSDTFLDTALGARTDLWALQPVSDAATCEKDSSSLAEGCWEFHLGQIVQETDGEWARDLLAMLTEARSSRGRNEKDEL
ncbi:ribosomal protein S15 [Pestalotiopsis sp. IQ-011]